MTITMKETPLEERPREKYKKNGFERLSDADLIAIILRSGTKDMSVKDLSIHILKEVGGILELNNTSLESLSKIKGVGEVKAITLLSAVELGKRMRIHKTDKNKIKTANDLYEIFAPSMEDLTQEHFIAVFLNSKNEIIDSKTIFIGSANKSTVHPRDIYKEALKYSAVKIMVLHNHPSGDVTPSTADVAFTSRLLEAGNLLQIPLLDHIIIGKNNYYSFYDHVMK